MHSRTEQLRRCGIAIERDGELLLVEVDRSFQMLSLEEVERFVRELVPAVKDLRAHCAALPKRPAPRRLEEQAA